MFANLIFICSLLIAFLITMFVSTPFFLAPLSSSVFHHLCFNIWNEEDLKYQHKQQLWHANVSPMLTVYLTHILAQLNVGAGATAAVSRPASFWFCIQWINETPGTPALLIYSENINRFLINFKKMVKSFSPPWVWNQERTWATFTQMEFLIIFWEATV